MPVTLTISAESVEEFDTFLARFARSGAVAASAIMSEIAHTPAAQEAAAAAEPAPKGNARSRKKTDSDAPVDPFAAPETTATPAATSPADQAAADAGEVTMQMLKDALSGLLKAKSASVAMNVLKEASGGCTSLTSGSSNVQEKAKDDPSIMRRTLDALVAAKNAA